MNVLLTGATGFIGKRVYKALLNKGHHVIPVSRHHGFDMTQLLKTEDWTQLLTGVDCVINAAGIIAETRQQTFHTIHTQAPIALFRACKQLQIKTIIQISALGADKDAQSEYHLSKRAADEFLKQTKLNWFILQPSLIYGPEGRSSQLFNKIARLAIIPIIGDGQQLIQPVYIEDVIDCIIRCLHTSQARQTIHLVGPGVFTFQSWLQSLRQKSGLTAAPCIHIPLWAVYLSAQLLHRLFPLFNRETIQMLQRGNNSNCESFTRFLGRSPRALENIE